MNTARQQDNIVNYFLEWCKTKKITIKTIDYNHVMDFVSHCQSLGNKTSTIRIKIKALEYYFEFLELENNPATLVKLKGSVRKIPNHLLSDETLLNIYEKQRTKGLAGKRDKVLLSLVIFQGVRNLELEGIELKDVDLMKGKIYIPSIATSNSRTLDLKPFQMMLFQDYLLNIRPVLINENRAVTDQFLVGIKHSKQKLNNVIKFLLKRIRWEVPELKGMDQIRQSVITNWVKEHGLRKAQYMAGHKYVSSTERYNEDKLDGLKNELKMYHPM